MSNDKRAWFACENGMVIEGRSIGAEGERGGDLVFNTAMSGYHEILTDPSYAGQVVLMTYPLIGNYGVADEDAESSRAWAEAFVVKELSSIASNHRATRTLEQYLRDEGIVAIEGVDTRRLTKMTREEGSLRCIVTTNPGTHEELIARAKGVDATDGRDLASLVSCQEPYNWTEGYGAFYPFEVPETPEPRLKVVAYDFGVKRNILRSLVHNGFDVTVVPSHTPAGETLDMKPDGVFFSNGPGDPAAVAGATEARARPHRQGADLRHLPGAPDPVAGDGSQDLQDALRSPRREPPGARRDDGQGGDHLAEPLVRGRSRVVPVRARGHPPEPQRSNGRWACATAPSRSSASSTTPRRPRVRSTPATSFRASASSC